MTLPWHLYLMAFLYISAGLNHFRNPKMYIKIIPSYFSNPKLLNILSGAAEVILGILLAIPVTTHIAAWGIIALLIAVFPANLFMYQNKKAGFNLPKWILFVRLPLQIVLMLWAYQYTC
ncbi:DoxX family membrane protein [Flavobacterium sp. Fl-77]|uniref:DoxX family membrane protein n=1 Tax=Flavobacterium flavipigmentatum TaxID=2893884 RepID=A0AAJ2SEX9_9FLAO|nr:MULTISPECIES: MauE/DoxX family redox-associated membrane protein [unclassified Flavobacterium]MDX6182277.1 DoxX family membrane protein [Flavobacterium sp. Fl-33]MDX6185810.1 DoxX family membrane protein [Flavobacterium sp. Fl-77]UFH38990.1 DoxX family membrane protein [Flavobacterium sp. F-70]